jgi:Tfp pilus assembly protein PilF
MGGDKDEAQKIAEKLTKDFPQYGYLAQADLAQQAKKYDKAEQLFQKALSAGKNQHQVLTNFAMFYFEQKKWDKTEEVGRKAISADPKRSNGYELTAYALARQRKVDGAGLILAEAEKQVPHNRAAFYRGALGLFEVNAHLPTAEKWARHYVGQPAEGYEPTLAEGHYLLARILQEQGKNSEARAQAEQALKHDPTFGLARDLLKKL